MSITLNHVKTDTIIIQDVEQLDVRSHKVMRTTKPGHFWSAEISIKTDDGETTIKIFTEKKLDLSGSYTNCT